MNRYDLALGKDPKEELRILQAKELTQKKELQILQAKERRALKRGALLPEEAMHLSKALRHVDTEKLRNPTFSDEVLTRASRSRKLLDVFEKDSEQTLKDFNAMHLKRRRRK